MANVTHDNLNSVVLNAREHSPVPLPFKALQRGLVVTGADDVGGVPVYDDALRYQHRGMVTFDNVAPFQFGVMAHAFPASLIDAPAPQTNGPVTGRQPTVSGLLPAFGADTYDPTIAPAVDWSTYRGGQAVSDRVAGIVLPGIAHASEEKIFFPLDIVAHHRGVNLPRNSTLVWDQKEGERYIEENAPLHRSLRVTFLPDKLSGGQGLDVTLAANYLTREIVMGYGAVIHNGPSSINAPIPSPPAPPPPSPDDKYAPDPNTSGSSRGPTTGGAAATGATKIISYWPQGMNGPVSPGKGAGDEHIFDKDRENLPHVPLHINRDFFRLGPAPKDLPWAPLQFEGLAAPKQVSAVIYRAEIVYDDTLDHPNPKGRNTKVQGRWVVQYRMPEAPPKPPTDTPGPKPGSPDPITGGGPTTGGVTGGGGGGPNGAGPPPGGGAGGGPGPGGGPDGDPDGEPISTNGNFDGNLTGDSSGSTTQGPSHGGDPPGDFLEATFAPDGEFPSDPVGNWSTRSTSREAPEHHSLPYTGRAPFRLPAVVQALGAENRPRLLRQADPYQQPDIAIPVPLASISRPYGPITVRGSDTPNSAGSPISAGMRVKALAPTMLIAPVIPPETLREARFDAAQSSGYQGLSDTAPYGASLVPFGDSRDVPDVFSEDDGRDFVRGGFILLPPGMKAHDAQSTELSDASGSFALRPENTLDIGIPLADGTISEGLSIGVAEGVATVNLPDSSGAPDSSRPLQVNADAYITNVQADSNAGGALRVGDAEGFDPAFADLSPFATLPTLDAEIAGFGTEVFTLITGTANQVGMAEVTVIGREATGNMRAARFIVTFETTAGASMVIVATQLSATVDTMTSAPVLNFGASGSDLRLTVDDTTGNTTHWVVSGDVRQFAMA